jgi:hypothetical protein
MCASADAIWIVHRLIWPAGSGPAAPSMRSSSEPPVRCSVTIAKHFYFVKDV